LITALEFLIYNKRDGGSFQTNGLYMFQKMDGNRDGVVTLSEFLEACRADPDISTSMAALDTAF
ncbi:hypothetical protein EAI_10204, partial [Harpegnathos saltator]